MPWPVRELKNWGDFDDLARRFDVGAPGSMTYVYRGQANDTWDNLEPSLLRRVRDALDTQEVFDIERNAITVFKQQAHHHLASEDLPQNDLAWLIAMQHYRAPTRLLDWTASIYVAAYFAIGEPPEADGVIWLFQGTILNREMNVILSHLEESKWFFDRDVPRELAAIQPARLSTRAAAQQAMFTVCRDPCIDHAEVIHDALVKSHGERVALHKLIIPSRLKPEFLRRLRTMNITANSLFPGVDGLGKSVDEFVQLTCAFKAAQSAASEHQPASPGDSNETGE